MPALAPLLVLLLQPVETAVAEGPAPAATTTTAAPVAPPLDSERPARSGRAAATAEQAAAWERERRRLQIHAGLSGGFASAMLVTGTLLLTIPDGCTNIDVCEINIGRYLAGIVMLPLAIIPASTGIYWGVRLHRHDRQRPVALLRPRAGGFILHF